MDIIKTVFTFSLFGYAYQYLRGLVENCEDINKIYPAFWIYVYLGNDFDRSILDDKFSHIKNIKFIETNVSGSINMCYRFFAIDDNDVNIMFSRDADSRINERDQYCINKFLSSEKLFQIIRDDPNHLRFIMGGMWGIKKGCVEDNIKPLFLAFFLNGNKNTSYQCDQDLLSEVIYPMVKNKSMIFDNDHHFIDESPDKIEVNCRDECNHVGARIPSSYEEQHSQYLIEDQTHEYITTPDKQSTSKKYQLSILHTIKFR